MVKKCILISLLGLFCLPCMTFAAAHDHIHDEGADGSKDSCVECHVKLDEKLSGPVTMWRGSAHMLKGKDCSLCHGGNSTIDSKKAAKSIKHGYIGIPDKKKMTEFCGRDGCHGNEISNFKNGPHYASVLKTGKPGCVTCHGSHTVRVSFNEIINDKNCSSCHTSEYSREMVSSLSGIRERIRSIQEDIKFLDERQIEVPEFKSRIVQVTGRFKQLLHVFTRESMTVTRSEIDIETQILKTESSAKVSISRRINLLYLIMIVIGFSSLFTYILYTFIMYLRRK